LRPGKFERSNQQRPYEVHDFARPVFARAAERLATPAVSLSRIRRRAKAPAWRLTGRHVAEGVPEARWGSSGTGGRQALAGSQRDDASQFARRIRDAKCPWPIP